MAKGVPADSLVDAEPPGATVLKTRYLVLIFLALMNTGQYVEGDEQPPTGFLPPVGAPPGLSGESDSGCRARAWCYSHRDLHERPVAADRAEERRADGCAFGSRQRAPDAPVAASHRGRCGLERCRAAKGSTPPGAARDDAAA